MQIRHAGLKTVHHFVVHFQRDGFQRDGILQHALKKLAAFPKQCFAEEMPALIVYDHLDRVVCMHVCTMPGVSVAKGCHAKESAHSLGRRDFIDSSILLNSSSMSFVAETKPPSWTY